MLLWILLASTVRLSGGVTACTPTLVGHVKVVEDVSPRTGRDVRIRVYVCDGRRFVKTADSKRRLVSPDRPPAPRRGSGGV